MIGAWGTADETEQDRLGLFSCCSKYLRFKIRGDEEAGFAAQEFYLGLDGRDLPILLGAQKNTEDAYNLQTGLGCEPSTFLLIDDNEVGFGIGRKGNRLRFAAM